MALNLLRGRPRSEIAAGFRSALRRTSYAVLLLTGLSAVTLAVIRFYRFGEAEAVLSSVATDSSHVYPLTRTDACLLAICSGWTVWGVTIVRLYESLVSRSYLDVFANLISISTFVYVILLQVSPLIVLAR